VETYAVVVLYAIPFFLGLILVEWIAARRMGVSVMRSADTLSSLSSGTTNTLKTVLGLSVGIISYDWLVDHVALYTVESTWLAVVITFLVKDFGGYWNHRFNHEINVLWNRHIIHHSSEEFNLACALRQSISEIWVFFALFMLPAALLGVPTEVIAIVAPLHLFAQFWYHTRLIGKMGWLESILVTPSHHRVHHAINDEYIDKNYSEVFIIWDKLFGTFQEEKPDVEPVYGVKKAVKTWNPFLINFQHLWRLWTDAWRTKSWKDKARIWFMPTGWRPADVAEKYPFDDVLTGDRVYQQEKYDSRAPTSVLAFSWLQFVIAQLLMVYLFSHLADIGVQLGLTFGIYLFLTLFSLTSLLDKSYLALAAEALRLVTAAVAILVYDGWFGLEQYVPAAGYLILGYSLASLIATWRLLRSSQSEITVPSPSASTV
jgi:sterol desaturase/sphingolipid hydroxylase (fatty acid hydroxylase superfamily)